MTMKKTGGAICAVSIVVGIVLSMDSGLRINREGLDAITAKIDELEALLVKLNEQRREIINYLGTNKK